MVHTNEDELKNIYLLFISSVLEQSATVWHSTLTEDNKNDLERVQKTALKIILGEKYQNYQNALDRLDILNLSDRRNQLCLNFARKCFKNPKTKKMFPINDKTGHMATRQAEKFKVQHANTDRLRNSSIIFMQNLLNKNEN